MLVRPERNTTNTVLAKPPARLSIPTARYISGTSWPRKASRINSRLVAAVAMAPSIIMLMILYFCANKPPTNPPAIDMTMPNDFTA